LKKIPTIFERDWDGDRSRVIDVPNPAAAWVFAGEGVATVKLDGVACMFDGERWWKRRELKPNPRDGSRAVAPPEFQIADEDETTGKVVGWVPISDGPEDKYMREAIVTQPACGWEAGTYEFLGPKSQGNVENATRHTMVEHGLLKLQSAPRTFDALREYLKPQDIEGIVWHHPDGRMAKIKKRDFGLKRAPE
jgi:hypothetical protein